MNSFTVKFFVSVIYVRVIATCVIRHSAQTDISQLVLGRCSEHCGLSLLSYLLLYEEKDLTFRGQM